MRLLFMRHTTYDTVMLYLLCMSGHVLHGVPAFIQHVRILPHRLLRGLSYHITDQVMTLSRHAVSSPFPSLLVSLRI
jgi:hypothetical protein